MGGGGGPCGGYGGLGFARGADGNVPFLHVGGGFSYRFTVPLEKKKKENYGYGGARFPILTG